MQAPPRTIRHLLVISILIGCCLFYAGCKHTDPDPLQDLSTNQVTILNELNNAITPINDADPTRDFADLAPLDSLVAKAQVVGLGEATHGTHEFFQMKDRLFRYMVQHHGYKAIGFEATFGRCVEVNRYIHGQPTSFLSSADAAKYLYLWPWQTTEVRDLLEWMKQYNATKSASEQISFYGFDCQYAADDEFQLISEFLNTTSPTSVAQIDSLSQQNNRIATQTTTDDFQQTYAKRIADVYTMFVTNENKWAVAGGRTNYELAKQAARILVQYQDIRSSSAGACAVSAKRDQYMVENVQWLRNGLNISKLTLWAHNVHVSVLTNADYCGAPTMGTFLKQQLNDKYLIVGTSLSNGSFTVHDASKPNASLTTLSVRTESLKNSFNYLFGKAQYANFMLNLNQTKLGPSLKNWVDQMNPTFEPGAGYDESKSQQYYFNTKLRGRYDVLIHFRDTSPTHLLL